MRKADRIGKTFVTRRPADQPRGPRTGRKRAREPDDGDNGPPGPFSACAPRPGTLAICPGGFEYFKSRIGVTPITNLDISYQLQEHVRFGIGALTCSTDSRTS